MSKERQERQKRQRLKNNSTGLVNSLRGMGTGQQPSLWSSLSALSVPTLLLTGALDRKYVNINEQMVLQIPNSMLRIIPDTGHNIHLEKPELFAEVVSVFLNLPQ